MNETMRRFGVETLFCDADDLETIEKHLDEGVKLVLCESVGNPNLRLPDLSILGKLCERHRTLFAVDNTLTPLIVKPFEHGADIVLYSTTKIISGHSAALGGAAVFRRIGENDPKFSHPRYDTLRPLATKGLGAIFKKKGVAGFRYERQCIRQLSDTAGIGDAAASYRADQPKCRRHRAFSCR